MLARALGLLLLAPVVAQGAWGEDVETKREAAAMTASEISQRLGPGPSLILTLLGGGAVAFVTGLVVGGGVVFYLAWLGALPGIRY